MASGGMLLNIILNLILIPRYYAAGAAISSLVTQFTTALIQVLIAYKIFKLKVDFKFSGLLILFLLSTVVISFYSSQLKYTWGTNFMVATTGCFAAALLLRLLKPKSIYKILKYG